MVVQLGKSPFADACLLALALGALQCALQLRNRVKRTLQLLSKRHM